MDSSTKETSSGPNVPTEGPTVNAIFLLLIGCPIIAATIIGNLLVIAVWIFQKSMRTPPYAYFVSLAFADLIVGVFVSPMTIAYGYNQKWIYGLPACQTWQILCFSLNAVTSYHLVAIAGDRYRTLTEGVTYLQRRSLKSVFEICIIIWLGGFWVALPLVLDWDHTAFDPMASKNCVSKKIPSWVVHIIVASLGLPLYFIARIHYKIFMEIRKRLQSRIFVTPAPSSTGTTGSGDLERTAVVVVHLESNTLQSPPETQVESAASIKEKATLAKEERAAFTLRIIIGAFVICWLPWYSLTVFDMLVPKEWKPSPFITMWLVMLGFASSCVNPIIYSARIPEFRKAVQNILHFP